MKAGEISGKASADSFSFFFFLPSFGSCKQKQKDPDIIFYLKCLSALGSTNEVIK